MTTIPTSGDEDSRSSPGRAPAPAMTVTMTDPQTDRTRTGDGKQLAAEGVEMIDGRPRDVYDRFTRGQKRRMTAIVSFSALLSPMASAIFLPSIPQLADDLQASETIINVTVAIFILVIGFAPIIWSPLSGFYGRKPVYLASMPLMIAGSIGVAVSRTVGDVIGTRILQGVGSSAVLAVGAGTIGDIYRPTERANAMGWFYSGALLGPALSPVIAGVFTEYTAQTWRSAQYFLVGTAACSFLLTLFFLPETHHRPLPHDILKKERGKKFVPYLFNPFTSLGLFRYLNICCITFVSSSMLFQLYCLLVPLSSVFQARYNISNVAIAGTLYLASGVGNIVGARVAGPWADATVKRYIRKRGFRRPEDRLKAAVLGVGAILPLSGLAYGWLVQYGAGGMAPPLVMTAISGFGLMITITPLNTYAVDCMQTRSAEVIAVNNFVRYIFSAAASAFVLPLAQAIGWGLTMMIASILCWLALIALLVVIKYGHIWRRNTNIKQGIDTPDDEQSPPDQTDPTPEACDVDTEKTPAEVEAEAEARERQMEREPLSDMTRAPRTTTTTNVTRSASRASRTRPGEMPPVQQVLSRTISMSRASVHGGG